MQGTDKARIEDKLKVLTDASAKMAERIYAKKSSEGQAAQGQTQSQESTKPAEEGVVDAEFEEVKEEDKK